MAVFTNTQQALQDPQYWGQYTPTMGTPEYDDYAAWEAQQPWMQPAGTAPGTFTGPDGQQWSSAGSQRMADMTQGEYQADLLNHRLMQAGLHPDSPDAKMLQMALTSRAQVRPDEMLAAYMAHDAQGNQQLVSPLASLLERLGIRPAEYTAPEAHVVKGDSGRDQVTGTMPKDGKSGTGEYTGTTRTQQNVPGYHYEGDILVKGDPASPGAKDTRSKADDHAGQIYVDGTWINDMPIVPQSPYPPLSDVPLSNSQPGAKTQAADQVTFNNFLQWHRRQMAGRPPVAPPTGYGF